MTAGVLSVPPAAITRFPKSEQLQLPKTKEPKGTKKPKKQKQPKTKKTKKTQSNQEAPQSQHTVANTWKSSYEVAKFPPTTESKPAPMRTVQRYAPN